MKTHPTLYKRDTSGKVRVWFMRTNGDRHQTVSGIMNGFLVESGWTVCTPKNVGRSNETTPEQQAELEVKAEYQKALDRDYYDRLEDIDNGKFFQVMLASKYAGWPGRGHWAQPKLDGFRCRVTKDGMFSRQCQPITGAPHIHEALAQFFHEHPGAVLDGELYNHDLKDDFEKLSSILKKQKPTEAQLAESREKIQFWVYDYISEGKHPFGQRYELLGMDLMPYWGDVIVPVHTVHVGSQELLDQLYGEWLEAGFEGQMIRLDAPYEQTRSKSLQKRKEFQDREFECVAIEEGLGNWAGLAKRVVCRLPDGRTFGAGIKGNQKRAAELLSETHNIVTVQFFQLTNDGIPRFPVVTKFHGEGRTL